MGITEELLSDLMRQIGGEGGEEVNQSSSGLAGIALLKFKACEQEIHSIVSFLSLTSFPYNFPATCLNPET